MLTKRMPLWNFGILIYIFCTECVAKITEEQHYGTVSTIVGLKDTQI